MPKARIEFNNFPGVIFFLQTNKKQKKHIHLNSIQKLLRMVPFPKTIIVFGGQIHTESTR